MESNHTIKLKALVKAHDLQIMYATPDYETFEISSYDVSRPGLQLAGFYEYFHPQEIQIIGKLETAFLKTLDEIEREKAIDAFFAANPIAVIVCHRLPPDYMLVDAAKRYNVNLLMTDLPTSEFMSQIINTLRSHLAPRITMHGVLVQVSGEGLLIIGESGIGKSETALELVKRGHRLIADDAVEVRRMGRDSVTGSAPKMIRYMMELRGIGIIDVRQLYGIGSVLPYGKIDLVVNFQKWEEGHNYDRLGTEETFTDILGVKIPQSTIPVAPARNLAIILEVAAINHRQRRLGYNAGAELVKRHDDSIDSGWQV